jgi:DNA-3-methyladenine glycosylase I
MYGADSFVGLNKIATDEKLGAGTTYSRGMEIVHGHDGRPRCAWGAEPPDYAAYHDLEWGFGESDDARLFEKLVLEGFQSGLSWLTILRKRDAFREVFAGFDPATVAVFDDDDVARLLGDPRIVRHEQKIRSAVNNAGRALDLIDEEGGLAPYLWRFADPPGTPAPSEIRSTTERSTELARDLKRRGWTYVGPTTAYAFMQAMGLVNDHVAGCWVRARAETSRTHTLRRVLEG